MEDIIPLVEKLKKLGLSSYEAQAYLVLLKLGIADAGEISLHGELLEEKNLSNMSGNAYRMLKKKYCFSLPAGMSRRG